MRANKYEWQFDAKIESIKCSAFNVMCLPGSNFINTIGKHTYEIQCRERCCDWRPLSGRWYSIQYSANQCNTIPQHPIKFDEQFNLPNLIRKYFVSLILWKSLANAFIWSFWVLFGWQFSANSCTLAKFACICAIDVMISIYLSTSEGSNNKDKHWTFYIDWFRFCE